ncbi:DUF2218 domain-containing protein [Nocardia sp. KC 131]|uniref:DUF2218 domain-containing protein n=1 Tax=Nocardia arseniciresistens TaxID=3392119 RepID=UPI00398F5D40
MPIIEARITTDRPDRYLRQFRKHATAMASPRAHKIRMHGKNPVTRGQVLLRVEATDALTTIHFDTWGRCMISADGDLLIVRIDATDDLALQRIQDTITRDIDRFGRGALIADWREPDDSGTTTAEAGQ